MVASIDPHIVLRISPQLYTTGWLDLTFILQIKEETSNLGEDIRELTDQKQLVICEDVFTGMSKQKYIATTIFNNIVSLIGTFLQTGCNQD